MFVQLLSGSQARVIPVKISTDDLVKAISAVETGRRVHLRSSSPKRSDRLRFAADISADSSETSILWQRYGATRMMNSVRARIPASDANHVDDFETKQPTTFPILPSRTPTFWIRLQGHQMRKLQNRKQSLSSWKSQMPRSKKFWIRLSKR